MIAIDILAGGGELMGKIDGLIFAVLERLILLLVDVG